MDYILSTKNSVDMLKEVLEGIYNQNNVNNVIVSIDENSDDGTINLARNLSEKGVIDKLLIVDLGMNDAKIKAFKESGTDYVVFLDEDVYLGDGWIEKMFSELNDFGSVRGIVYPKKQHLEYFKNSASVLENLENTRMQNTVVRRKALEGIKVQNKRGVDPDPYFSLVVRNNGFRNKLIPVFSRHVRNHRYNAFGEGIRGSSRRRKMGICDYKDLFSYVINTGLGALKISCLERKVYFIRNALKRIFGFIIGFFKSYEYSVKYDYCYEGC